MRLRVENPDIIPSHKWVRALVRHGCVHYCSDCGQRMLAKPASGLCPFCFTARQSSAIQGSPHLELDFDLDADFEL